MNIKSREQGNTKIIDKLVVVYAMRSVTGTKKRDSLHFHILFASNPEKDTEKICAFQG